MKRALVLAVLAALAGSCAPKRAAKPQEVVFWAPPPLASLEPLVRRFESGNPGLHVVLVEMGERSVADSVRVALSHGSVPDLCAVESGVLAPFMLHGDLSDWSAGVADLRAGLHGWDLCMVGDAIYGLPWRLRTRALFYNRTLLARAGLDSTRGPDTWDDLRSASARIARLGRGTHGYGLPAGPVEPAFATFASYAWGNGAEFLTSAHDSLDVASSHEVAALEFLLSLRKTGLVASPESLATEFALGRLGFCLGDASFAARLAREAAGLRYGVGPLPRPATADGRHAALLRGQVLVSFTSSHRKEDALKLARFLVDPRNSLELAAAEPSLQPANVGADSTAWFVAHPAAQALFRQIEFARTSPVHPRWPAMEALVAELVGQAIAGQWTAARALAFADSLAMLPVAAP